jgi:hypothetical protein
MPAVAVASARGCCSAALRRCGAPAARAALPAARLLQPLASRALRTCAPPRRRALPALRARSEGGKGEGDDVDFVESKLRAVAPLVDAAASLVPVRPRGREAAAPRNARASARPARRVFKAARACDGQRPHAACVTDRSRAAAAQENVPRPIAKTGVVLIGAPARRAERSYLVLPLVSALC